MRPAALSSGWLQYFDVTSPEPQTPDEEYRQLTNLERSLLVALTSQDFQGATTLRAQVEHARGKQGCGCGCGTMSIRVDQHQVPAADLAKGGLIPGEAAVTGPNGEPLGGLIAFARDGYLSCLEIYSIGDPAPLPQLDQIRPFVRAD